MKKISFCFAMFALIFCTYSCDVARSAQNKTNREISKKTNKKIEDIFNKKKQAPKDNGGSGGTGGDNGAGESNEPAELAKANRNKSDFIPGEKVIFMDSQRVEILGEFPSKWDRERGNIEIMSFENRNVIGYASGGTIFPLMDEKSYLPDRFTLEFDCYFHNYGNEAYSVIFDNPKANFTIRGGMVQAGGDNVRTSEDQPIGWKHIEVSFNKRSLKIYYNGERMANIPNLKGEHPTNVKFGALSHGAKKGKPSMIKNIRIAEGGVPLYHRLVTDGEFVTNDIHFDYNQADIKMDSWVILRQVADMMKEHSEVKLKIEGHTDSDGRDDYNLALSKKRAISVKNALVKEGISSGRLQTVGYGEEQPLDTSNTAEAKALNRRVAFVLVR